MIAEITSIHNSKVKQWSQLLTKRGREDQHKFILEGIHLVCEALQANIDLDVILYSLERGYPAELSTYVMLPCECIAVSEGVLAKCSDAQSPQGVLAIAGKLKTTVTVPKLFTQTDSLVIAVDGIQDPGNLGTIIRSADAVGATAVILGRGTVDLYNPKTVRSTMGSLFHLPIIECDLPQTLAKAQQEGIQIISASLQASAVCYSIDMKPATWFIVGNESTGVSSELAAYVTKEVIIPMPGRAESLNVAMAATVLLFEAMRQRIAFRG